VESFNGRPRKLTCQSVGSRKLRTQSSQGATPISNGAALRPVAPNAQTGNRETLVNLDTNRGQRDLQSAAKEIEG